MREQNDKNGSDVEGGIAENRFKQLDRALVKHRFNGDALIEILHTAQELFGYLSVDTLSYIAECLHLPVGKVYSVATFYPAFSLEPSPMRMFVLCNGTTCHLRGAGRFFESFGGKRAVRIGRIENMDAGVRVKPASCMGLCHAGPVGILGGEQTVLHVHENELTKNGSPPMEPEP